MCIDKGFIIFLTGAALSSVLLFVFEAYLKIMDALEVLELVLEVPRRFSSVKLSALIPDSGEWSLGFPFAEKEDLVHPLPTLNWAQH